MLVPPDVPQQVIVVTAPTWGSQRATLRRYVATDGDWVRVGRKVPAWVGINGFAPASTRRQNSGQTPAGNFTIPRAFGAGRGADIELPYHRITSDSYWPYDPRDPRTYNVLQTQRTTKSRWRADGEWSERLVDYGRAYKYAAVLGYNLPAATFRSPSGEWRARTPAKTSKGGGIFLHVSQNRPTAGCVAIPLPAMRTVVQWLAADASPLIVMGPRSVTRGWRTAVPAPR